MRVLIDTTYARRRPASGTAVYIDNLVGALSDAGVDVVTAANERRGPPGRGGYRSVVNLLEDVRWTARELPALARRHRVDVLHHPLPAHSRRARAPQVVTVHDLAYLRRPDLFDPAFARWARWTHRAAARRAAAVLCPSEATRRDVRELWGVEATVAHHGPGNAGAPLERATPRHFLYVGDAEPRKDLATLRAAHARLGPDAPPLVIAGGAGELVSSERLRELHAHAIALVHPALVEGFGLTVLEAMALGTPVIAARCPAVVEVAGDAVAYFEPGDIAGLVALLRSPPNGANGPARARAFSWARSARVHIEAYTLACRR